MTTLELPDELIVEVTAEDIRHGIRKNCRHCPIARATTRAVFRLRRGEEVAVFAAPATLAIRLPDGALEVFGTPDDAVHFMTRFDHGLPVEPETFTFRKG